MNAWISKRLGLFLILMLALIIAACGESSQQETPTPYALTSEFQKSDETSSTVTPVSEPTATPLPEPPMPAIAGIGLPRYPGKSVASLEDRAYKAEVIVRARLVSAASSTLEFRALEYLKGSGPIEFNVQADTANRDTQWDDQDAMLFLDSISGQSDQFTFTDSTTWDYSVASSYPNEYTGDLPEGYTLGTRNPVWLPVNDTGAGGVTGASSHDIEIVTEYETDGDPVVVLQSSLEGTLRWLDGPSQGAVSGATGSSDSDLKAYAKCIEVSRYEIRLWRDIEFYEDKPYEPPVGEVILEPGSPQGTVVYAEDHRFLTNESSTVSEVFGPDADLFASGKTYDSRTSRIVHHKLHTTRPLPAGKYEVLYRAKSDRFEPCDFEVTRRHILFEVTVADSSDTYHEAFFDPATTTTGVGFSADPAVGVGFSADPAAGVLEPTLLVATTSREIQGLEWADGEVRLTLSPFGALAHRQFEFLNLDADVILTLPTHIAVKDRAARTLTWDVPSQPWTSGDQLMLRVVPIPLPETHPTLRLVLTFGFGNAGVAFRWDALSDVDGSPVTGYSIEWSLSPYGPWAVVDSSGGGIRCVANMSFEPDEATQCQLTYIAAGLTGGQPYHFRLIAHSDNGDSLPSPSLDLRTR